MRRRTVGSTLAIKCGTASKALDVHLEDGGVMDEAIDGGERSEFLSASDRTFLRGFSGRAPRSLRRAPAAAERLIGTWHSRTVAASCNLVDTQSAERSGEGRSGCNNRPRHCTANQPFGAARGLAGTSAATRAGRGAHHQGSGPPAAYGDAKAEPSSSNNTPRATPAALGPVRLADGSGRGERRAIQHLTLAMSTLTLQACTIDWTALTKSGSRVKAC